MNLSLRMPAVVQQVSLRAIIYMTLSAFCFSTVELLGAYFVRGITLYQVVWGRYAVHLLFMLVVLGPRYKGTLVRSSRLPLQIIRSLTMVAMPVAFILATTQMPSHNVWAIYWLSPFMMLALSTWVLREPAGRVRWIAALVGFVGMMLVLRPDAGVFSPAAILPLIVGAAISLHLMFSRILRDDHPLTSLFHTALWVFIVMSFVMPLVWQRPALTDLIGVVIVGLVGCLALLVLARSGELVPLPVVASFSYTEGIWTMLLSALLFGQMPGKIELLGVVIIAGVTLYLFFYEAGTPYTEPEPVIEQA